MQQIMSAVLTCISIKLVGEEIIKGGGGDRDENYETENQNINHTVISVVLGKSQGEVFGGFSVVTILRIRNSASRIKCPKISEKLSS